MATHSGCLEKSRGNSPLGRRETGLSDFTLTRREKQVRQAQDKLSTSNPHPTKGWISKHCFIHTIYPAPRYTDSGPQFTQELTEISNSEARVTHGNNKNKKQPQMEKKWHISLHLSHQIQISPV